MREVPLVTVLLFRVSADRTPLARIGGIRLHDALVTALRFVQELLLQVVVGPGDRHVTVLRSDALGGAADPRQILDHEQSAFGL